MSYNFFGITALNRLLTKIKALVDGKADKADSLEGYGILNGQTKLSNIQLAATNSGINSSLVEKYEGYNDKINGKLPVKYSHIEIPHEAGSGWVKIAKLSGYYNLEVNICGEWYWVRPSNASFKISNVYGDVKINQIAGTVSQSRVFSKIRIVKESNLIHYLELYLINHDEGITGPQVAEIIGGNDWLNSSVVEVYNPTTIDAEIYNDKVELDIIDRPSGTLALMSEVDKKVDKNNYTEDDLNTITTSGFYRIGGSNLNRPDGRAHGQLLVMHGDGDTVTQIYGDWSQGLLYTRSGNPSTVGGVGGWTSWQRIAFSQEVGSKADNDNVYKLKSFETVPAYADLNTYKTPGTYGQGSSAAAATITNKPYTDSPPEFKLIVENYFSDNNQYILQRLTRWAKHEEYIRESTDGGNSWHNWQKIAKSDEVLPNYGWWSSDAVRNADDLRNGYVFAYAQSHNTPTTGTLLALSGGNENYSLQFNGGYSSNELWFRNRNGDNNTWKSWQKVYTEQNFKRIDGTAYERLGVYYGAGSGKTYIRIALPDNFVNVGWGMIMMDITVRDYYNTGTCGSIKISAYKHASAEWSGFGAITDGYLTNDIEVFGSDKKYLYIKGVNAWGGISVDRVLVGDSAVNIDISDIVIDDVYYLPEVYQTAYMRRTALTSDIPTSLPANGGNANYANVTGIHTSVGPDDVANETELYLKIFSFAAEGYTTPYYVMWHNHNYYTGVVSKYAGNSGMIYGGTHGGNYRVIRIENGSAYNGKVANADYADGSTNSYFVSRVGDIQYGRSGLQYQDVEGIESNVGNDPTRICNPTDNWYHHIVMNHPNSAGYYVDLAFNFFENKVFYRRVENGIDKGWVQLVDSTFNDFTQAVKFESNVTFEDQVEIYGDIISGGSIGGRNSTEQTWEFNKNGRGYAKAFYSRELLAYNDDTYQAYPLSYHQVVNLSHPYVTSGTIKEYRYGKMVYVVFDNVNLSAQISGLTTALTGVKDTHVGHLDGWGAGESFAWVDANGLLFTNAVTGISLWGVVVVPIDVDSF